MNTNNQKKIAVVGLGYVGLPLALLADRKGYKVIGLDNDLKKIKKINEQISPYEDKNIINQLKISSLEATSNFRRISETSIVIICVPTPVNRHHEPDLEPVKNASIEVGENIKKGHLVILESTVSPGVCEKIVLPIIEEISGLVEGKDFYLVHCPERINPGDKKWTIENIPRVIGGLNTQGLKRGLNFYRSIINADIRAMKSLKEAEAVKIVENSFRDINIAFVNELAQSFSHLGIDVVNVIDGASTKPFSFLAHYPGCGVGGHCIPVDPYYLIAYAKQNGFKHRFLALARKINNDMPKFTSEIVKNMLQKIKIPIKGAKVAVLGLAYKANVDDCRESPAFEIIKHLKKMGARVVSFDPHVLNQSTVKNLQEAVQEAKAVVIATDHKLFKNLSPQYFIKHNANVIIDGRNCLPERKFINSGIMYEGIGKHYLYNSYGKLLS